mmetsp:Transcript_5859/g.10433  ORF Transcript_5859/g.10433 Transcript_5859/m.10433 type:complete len:323 (+) Transcript_5859:1331-2299(+)
MLSRLSRQFATLVLAEHNNKILSPATRAAVSAATFLNEDVHVLVAGKNIGGVAQEAAKIRGVDKVLSIQHDALEHPSAEVFAGLLAALHASHNFTGFVAAGSNTSRDIIPRLGGLLNIQPITEVLEVKNAETFLRPMYAGNALQTVVSSSTPKILTIRATAFEKLPDKATASPIDEVSPDLVPRSTVEWVSEEIAKSDRPELANAKRIVTGGRGLKSKENFKLAEDLANVLGAALGATRAAVDAHYCPNDLQIGQTGKVVAPELYISLGVSGAIQHLAGMKDSKVIVSINTDPEAPIFAVSDYGLVGDIFKVVPELTAKLSK